MPVWPLESVWPVESIGTRRPVVSHEFEPVKHLGVDIMFRKLDGHGFEVPAGVYARACTAGAVLYAKPAPNGLRVRIRDQHGQDTVYLHLLSLSVHAGDIVAAGARLGLVGHDPSPADPAHVRHLHFEVRIKNMDGPRDGFGRSPVDPSDFIKTWSY